MRGIPPVLVAPALLFCLACDNAGASKDSNPFIGEWERGNTVIEFSATMEFLWFEEGWRIGQGRYSYTDDTLTLEDTGSVAGDYAYSFDRGDMILDGNRFVRVQS